MSFLWVAAVSKAGWRKFQCTRAEGVWQAQRAEIYPRPLINSILMAQLGLCTNINLPALKPSAGVELSCGGSKLRAVIIKQLMKIKGGGKKKKGHFAAFFWFFLHCRVLGAWPSTAHVLCRNLYWNLFFLFRVIIRQIFCLGWGLVA